MSATYRTRLTVIAAFLQSLAVLSGCGGQPEAAPSPVAVAPTAAPMASAPRLPATFDRAAIAALGLDPDYVRGLVYVYRNDDGSEAFEHPLEHWAGGPLVFCGDVDAADLALVLAEVRASTGLAGSIAEAGCNVRWSAMPGRGHTATGRAGGAIRSAQVYVYANASDLTSLIHEAGHVLGLGHSLHRDDLMDATPRPGTVHFSPAEAAVLRAMY